MCRGGGGKFVVSRSAPAQTPDTSPCLSTARGKPLQIQGKWRETKRPMPWSTHEPVGLVVIKGEQMFTGLQWVLEMGTTEVILHSKFCSKLNRATKTAIKCGAVSHFLHEISFGKSKGPNKRVGRRNLQPLKMINREGLLTLLQSRIYKSIFLNISIQCPESLYFLLEKKTTMF